MDLRRWNLEQMEQIRGPFNRWVTGKKVGHDPTISECVENYFTNGGPEAFAKAHHLDLNEETGELPAHEFLKTH